jgi:hypothetical protein
MNGKCIRVKGCWSRGIPRSNAFFSGNSKLSSSSRLFSIKFDLSLKSKLDNNQKNLLQYFEIYPYINRIESFSYDNNTPYSIINLYNNDFKNGTVRIKKPGIYRLQENIVFNPNESNDFSPTTKQISSGLYPENMSGPYHLGFFAAITVETNDVVIDLNGYTIKQSKLHKLQQRFYANIELANSPFIPKQGPSSFIGVGGYRPANRVLIMNGTSSSTSHHGIHANTANNVVLHNLNFNNFEVAGIALNGTTNAVINNVTIENNDNNIPVLSTYSQARFIRKFLHSAKQIKPDLKLSNSKTIDNIIQNIQSDLDTTFNQFKNNNTIPDNFFKNNNIEYDGNVYGIVLNVNGVVINDFITERTSEMIGNSNIFLNNININNISSTPVEIIGLNSNPSNNTAYGGRVQVGPLGDVLQMEHIQNNDGTYKANSLSDAQIILAEPSYTGPKGTNNIVNKVVEWTKNERTLSSFIGNENGKFYYLGGGDSMNHVMKGNIGLFISAGNNIRGDKIVISNIKSNGNNVGVSQLSPIQPDPLLKKGLNSHSLLITGSSNIYIENSNSRIMDAFSENGESNKIKLIGVNRNITVL